MSGSGARSRKRARIALCGFYSHDSYRELVERNIPKPLLADGASLNGVERLFLYTRHDLGKRFRMEYSAVLRHRWGYGYWCWKPHIILKALGNLDEGDYLCYSDVDYRGYDYAVHIATILDNLKQDIAADVHATKEFQYTKRDVLIALGCDSAEYTGTRQVQATCILMRKTRFVEEFMREWAGLCRDERLISGIPSRAPNLPGFIEHRHDQSFFSLLYKKRGLKLLNIDDIHRATGYNAYMRYKFRHSWAQKSLRTIARKIGMKRLLRRNG